MNTPGFIAFEQEIGEELINTDPDIFFEVLNSYFKIKPLTSLEENQTI